MPWKLVHVSFVQPIFDDPFWSCVQNSKQAMSLSGLRILTQGVSVMLPCHSRNAPILRLQDHKVYNMVLGGKLPASFFSAGFHAILDVKKGPGGTTTVPIHLSTKFSTQHSCNLPAKLLLCVHQDQPRTLSLGTQETLHLQGQQRWVWQPWVGGGCFELVFKRKSNGSHPTDPPGDPSF